MDYQLSAEVDKVVSKPKLNFLLVESSSPVRLDLELILRKRFPTAYIERCFLEAGSGDLHSIAWLDYDLVIVASEANFPDLTWLHAIERNASGLPFVLFLTDDPELGHESVWAGADLSMPLHESFNQLSTRLDRLVEVHRALKQYPLDLPQWQLQELLHNSENSIIFLAENRQRQQAAIKRFKFDVTGVTRYEFANFMEDARLLTALRHPGLVHLMDVGVSCGSVVIVMEYVQGQTLRAMISQHKYLQLESLIIWFKQITEALGVIHSLGLLHRDLKSSNIVMRDNVTPVLLDYGIESSLMLSSGFLQEDQIYCTPFYVSPERLIGEPASVQSDLYALGVLFYEMLVGEKPYRGSNLGEILQQQMFNPLPVLPAHLAIYQPLSDSLLAKLPESRPASCDAVLAWFNERGL